MYSAFGHETIIRCGSEKFPEWISQSSQDGTRMSLSASHDSWEEEFSDSSQLNEDGSTMCLKLPPNMSYDYMGMILCFKCPKDDDSFGLDYLVMTSSYNYMRSDTDVQVYGSCMVIVPRSVFSVTDADLRIVIKTYGDEEVLAHLLLKSEVKMTDEHNIRAVNDLKFVDPELLDIFLDIACFFIGWKYTEVVKILETWYSYVNHKIDFLKENCLLTINDTDKLEMPDWLQHIGRKIARNNSPDELEKHSRLWLSIDIFDLLKNHTGTIEIEGIVQSKVDYQDALEGESFTTKTFESMSKLRFLYLRNVNLIGSFERTLENLRWLCWDGCPLEYLPTEFYPQKLVILELSHSKLRTFWKPNMVSHVFDKLKTLNMSYSQDLITTPDFTKLPCLETLNFEYCESLEEVHESIGSLVRLFSLNLHDCGKLETLPDTICNLKALEYLEIGGCSGLYALPIEMGNIESLIVLNAKGLNVSKLPDTIGCLSKLVELRLGCNKNLEALPNTICNLSSLEILDISGCEKVEILPDKLWKLTRLNELNVSGPNRLIKLPDIEPSQIAFSLKTLKLSESSLTCLPLGISQLSALEYLDLTHCGNLLSIPELLPNMKQMYAGGCTSMKRLPNLSNLKQLEGLVLEYCSGLTVILGLEELTSITEIYLQGCTSSLLAQTLTKRLFQIYFGFGHLIKIYPQVFPDWISQSENSRYWTPNIEGDREMSLRMPPNESHNLLGMILCFEGQENYWGDKIDYSVENTTTGFIWRGLFYLNDCESLMVILPISIFPITDADEKIVLTSYDASICGIYLLYKSEDGNADKSNSSVSDLESKNWLFLGTATFKRWAGMKVTALFKWLNARARWT